MLTADDRKKLRELAEAEPPGKWQDGIAGRCNLVSYDGDDVVGIAYVPSDRRRAFIAAASPDAVKALLDQVERLERERDEAIGAGRSRAEAARLLAGQESRLRGRIERLERIAEYAKHTPLCWDLMFHDERPCSCGLDAARSAVADRTKEG